MNITEIPCKIAKRQTAFWSL